MTEVLLATVTICLGAWVFMFLAWSIMDLLEQRRDDAPEPGTLAGGVALAVAVAAGTLATAFAQLGVSAPGLVAPVVAGAACSQLVAGMLFMDGYGRRDLWSLPVVAFAGLLAGLKVHTAIPMLMGWR